MPVLWALVMGKSLLRKKSAKQYLKGSWPKFESGSPLLTAGQVPPKPQLQHEELRQNLLPTSSSASVGECWRQQNSRLSAFSCSSLHHLSPMRNLRKPLVSDAALCFRSWNLSETKSWLSTLFIFALNYSGLLIEFLLELSDAKIIITFLVTNFTQYPTLTPLTNAWLPNHLPLAPHLEFQKRALHGWAESDTCSNLNFTVKRKTTSDTQTNRHSFRNWSFFATH